MRTAEMMRICEKNNAADAFAVGFIYGGNIYGFLCDTAYALSLARRDKTSKKHGRKACLRLRFTADEKRELATEEYFSDKRRLCTLAEFEAMKRDGENFGHVFERLMRDKYNGITCKRGGWWESADFNADCRYYSNSGKVILDWTNIQAKFDGGTFCTVDQCEALKA